MTPGSIGSGFNLRILFLDQVSTLSPGPSAQQSSKWRSSGESPDTGWVTWYKISKNLGDFYHLTF